MYSIHSRRTASGTGELSPLLTLIRFHACGNIFSRLDFFTTRHMSRHCMYTLVVGRHGGI